MTHTHWYLLLIPVISLFIDLCFSIHIYFTYSLACPQVTFTPPRSHTVLGDDCPICFAGDALCHLAGQRHDRDGKHCK